jgi:hypothetical protein
MLLLFCLAVSSSGLVIFIDHSKAPRNIPLAERTESAMETQSIGFFLLYTLSLCFTLRSHGVSPMRNGAKQALAKLKRRRCSD